MGERGPIAVPVTPGVPRRPPETRPVVWNRTVHACCHGWSGPRCTEGKDGCRGTATPPCRPPGAGRQRRCASPLRRGRLAGTLLRCVALPRRRQQPQPLRHEPGRVLPAPLGSQLEEQLGCALRCLQPPAPRRWVLGRQGWDGTGWDGMGRNGTGQDGTRWDGTEQDRVGWRGTEWDGMGTESDGMGQDRTGAEGRPAGCRAAAGEWRWSQATPRCWSGGAAPMGARSLPERTRARAETSARGSGRASWLAVAGLEVHRSRSVFIGLFRGCVGAVSRGGVPAGLCPAADFAIRVRPGSTFLWDLSGSTPSHVSPGVISRKLCQCKHPGAVQPGEEQAPG